MTTIAVLGATGLTGQKVVTRALAAGHRVTALVRRPSGLPVEHENLTVIVGDATDRDTIERVSTGADGVIAALGRPAAGTTRSEIDDSLTVDVCAESTRHLFELAASTGTKRLVLMSTHGAGGSNDGSPYTVWLRELVGNRVRDKDDMEAYIAASDADVEWTVIRNPSIYEGPSAPYSVHEQIELDRSSRITYGDLADFAISEVVAPQHMGQFLTITEPLDPTRLRP